MKSFLRWQLKVCIHTKMVNTSEAAVLPRKAFLFLPRRHLFRFGKLNAFTAQIRGYKIDFFFVEKFSTMTTEGLYSYKNGKYLRGGCFTQESLTFFVKASPIPFWQTKCLYCSDQWKWNWFFFMLTSFLPWQMKVCIHTIMVSTSGAAVLPKKIFLFVPRRHLFRFGKLKTILSPSQDPKKLNDFDFINQCLTISNVCYGLKKTGWSL